MKRLQFSDNTEWLDARKGKVTGTRVKDIVVKRATKPKKAFYELIAERIAIPRGDENRMDRGHTLEAEAVERLAQETGLPFVQVNNEIWTREDEQNIAYSPDGYIEGEKITTACEIKCLNSASQLEAFIRREIPSDYTEQTRQAFVVNDDLETLYFAMYDPSLPPTCDFLHFVITREEIAEEVQTLYDYQMNTLSEVDDWVSKLTF